MRTLLLYNGAEGLGGIETLMARLATCLAERGDDVTCLLRDASPICELFPAGVRVVSAGLCLSNLMHRGRCMAFAAAQGVGAVNCIVSMDRLSATLAPLLARHLGGRARCIATNWVPNYVANLVEHRWHPMSLMQRHAMTACYDERSMLFMNDQYVRDAQRVLGADFRATIFPVSVNREQFVTLARQPDRNLIVSIGRLEPMKEYNFYMLEVIDELRAEGRNVRWDVYGYGEFEAQMQAEIERRGLGDRVALRGTLERNHVPAILAKAGIFVGMGRAAMEAACAGVPHVVAIAFDRRGITHGPLYRAAFGNIGDHDDECPTFRVTDEIRRLLDLSDAAYRKESDRVFSSMEQYAESDVMRILFTAITTTPPRCAGGAYAFWASFYVVVRSLGRSLWR